MRFFIDTANVDEIRKAAKMGFICGVTTNPSLIAKEGRDFNEVIQEITQIVDGPISGEVISLEAEKMIEEAREIAKIHPNMVVKIPMTAAGLEAVSVVSKEGIKTKDVYKRQGEDIVYRRDVLKELAACPSLVEKMAALCGCIRMISRLKDIHMAGEYGPEAFREFGTMQEAYEQMKAMHQELEEQMKAEQIHSQGLLRLHDVLTEKLKKNFCDEFEKNWASRTSGMERIASVSLEFSLDEEMHIQGAAITGLYKEKYGKNGFLQRKKENMHEEKPWDLSSLKDMITPAEELLEAELRFNQKEFYQLLYRMTLDMDDLYQDLTFYLGALEYCRRMGAAHISLCLPRILEKDHKGYRAKGLVNPVLVVLNPSKKPVANDVDFREIGRAHV